MKKIIIKENNRMENNELFYKVYTDAHNKRAGNTLPCESSKVPLAEWLIAAKERGHDCSYIPGGKLEYSDSQIECGSLIVDELPIIVRRDCSLSDGNWSECIRLA